MDLVYYDPYPNKKLEAFIAEYSALLVKHGEKPITCKRLETVEEVLRVSDVGEHGARACRTPILHRSNAVVAAASGHRATAALCRGSMQQHPFVDTVPPRSAIVDTVPPHSTSQRHAHDWQIAPDAAAVSLHCNLDSSTRHLMNKERLSMMKPDAVLVNAARGPVIDEAALVAHLQANPDFKAALVSHAF